MRIQRIDTTFADDKLEDTRLVRSNLEILTTHGMTRLISVLALEKKQAARLLEAELDQFIDNLEAARKNLRDYLESGEE